MNNHTSLLSQVENHWNEKGWDSKTLSSFTMSEGQGQVGDGGQSSQSGNENQGQGNEHSLAAGFLQNVPDNERPIVEKYVKDWDGQVTKKFQELHSQYQPYQELGDPQTLQQALQIANMLSENPEGFVEALYEAMPELFEEDAGEQGLEGEQGNPDFQGLPEPFVQQFGQMQQVVETLAQIVLDQQESTTIQQEDAELDDMLAQLKEQHGDFDEEYVLLKIYNGMAPEKAIEAFQNLSAAKQEEIANKTKGIPPTLTGGAVPGAGTRKIGEIPGKEVQNLVAGLLAQSQGN